MTRPFLYRNIRAGDLLESFLVAAASSLLVVRFYLHLADYPQIGGRYLHVAHVLWGGLLLATGLVLLISFMGSRLQRIAAIIGGIGFGIFIDELGKFLTRDNNYFFQPAVGLIYATFILLYLVFRFLGRTTPLSSTEYQLNALAQLEEAVAQDMDENEKARVKDLLSRADQSSIVTQQLQKLLETLPTVPVNERRHINRAALWLHNHYVRLVDRRDTRQVVRWLFVGEALIFLLGISATLATTLDDALDPVSGAPRYVYVLGVGQLISSAVAACLIVAGAVMLTRSRLAAYEYFRRALLVNIFLTEFFIFSRAQFEALPSFAVTLALFLLVRYAITQERRRGGSVEVHG